MNWHQLSTNEVFSETGSSPGGLAAGLAEERLNSHGSNELEAGRERTVWQHIVNQFSNFMILVLIAAAVISGIIGDMTDTLVILTIVLINAVAGFIQEYRAEKAIAALKKIAVLHSQVMRAGEVQVVLSTTLVPGDVVLLEAGTLVPADLRLFETNTLAIEEASLTGESVPADKTTAALEKENIPLGDRNNMAYKGTKVIRGNGKGIVVATGMNTEIGHIARLLQQQETETPLQKKMAAFAKKLSYIILLICLALFAMGLLRGEKPLSMLLVAVSLAVAAIPEALPALTTIALARGAKRLAKKNALIRKLPAVETLGSVSFICTDKTGTLTQNKMTVTETTAAEGIPGSTADTLPILHLAMALNHNVLRANGDQWTGDPTEIALLEYVLQQHDAGVVQQLANTYPRVAEFPFDTERKCMTTIHRQDNGYLVVTKGAVEVVAEKLASGEAGRQSTAAAESFSSNGMRVLAFAVRSLDQLPEPLNWQTVEKEMHFAGLAALTDPPRPGIEQAVRECRQAGIQPVMITGDHLQTAVAIARQIGILHSPGDSYLSGPELERLTEEALQEKVEHVKVYARVSPEQKLIIVKALQRKQQVVAMTGDGVNDAPSLKAADIGIAMGITGTDVSKEAATMILLDDNFTTIVRAVREGRRIYDNIRKFVKYIMTCNGAEICTIFIAPLLSLPIPLLPIHLLWINLVTDGLPGLALSAEKAEPMVMRRPPRKAGEGLFGDGLGYHIVWMGLLMAFVTLGIQALAIQQHKVHWQTMVFTVLSLSQLGHVLAVRSDQELIYKKGFLSNIPLLLAVAFTILLQLAILYIPFLNTLFKTQPLPFTDLIICLGAATIVFHAAELQKWLRLRKDKKKARTQQPAV